MSLLSGYCKHDWQVRDRTVLESGFEQLAKAGADFVLMPSRYEPCGLPQMECPRFGTLPIARLTGGLRDTVFELNEDATEGNGFVFEEYSPSALEAAIVRAVRFFGRSNEIRKRAIQRIMKQSRERFTLAHTAKMYSRLYDQLIAGEGIDSAAFSDRA